MTIEQWGVIVQSFGVVGTLCLGWLAARHLILPPRLRVSLREREDTFFEEEMPSGVQRYIHLTVTNGKRRPTAENVRVYLKRIDRNVDGKWETIFKTGNVMLQWQFEAQNVSGTQARYRVEGLTVPPVQTCDLGRVIKGKGFTFKTAIDVAGMKRVEELFSQQGTMAIRTFLQAQGSNTAPSNTLIVEMSWDGEYHSDDAEMAKHFRFKAVNG